MANGSTDNETLSNISEFAESDNEQLRSVSDIDGVSLNSDSSSKVHSDLLPASNSERQDSEEPPSSGRENEEPIESPELEDELPYMTDVSKLTNVEAHNILSAVANGTFDGNVLPLQCSNIKGGNVYVLSTKERSKQKDLFCDKMMWVSNGTTCVKNINLTKRYWYVNLGKQSDIATAKTVQREIITFTNHDGPEFPVIKFYKGDMSLWVPRPHGNCKTDRPRRSFVRTIPSRLGNMKKMLSEKKETPQETYTDAQVEGIKELKEMRELDVPEDLNALRPMVLPRNPKQARNLKYVIGLKNRICPDAISAVIALKETVFRDVVRQIDLTDGVCIVFGQPEAITLAKRLLEASRNDWNIEQSIHCDTTFKLGNFFLTCVLMRNTVFEGNPIVPILFLIHQTKTKEVHGRFGRDYVAKEFELNELCENCPIVTDRETAISDAITNSCEMGDKNLLFCHNHLKKNVKRWLEQANTTKDNMKILQSHFRVLLKSQTREEYDEKLEGYRSTWPASFVTYYDNHLNNDLKERAIAERFLKYASYQNIDHGPTNNPAESLNQEFKRAFKGKQAAFDVAVTCLSIYQNNVLNETNRGFQSEGSYELKPEYQGGDNLALQLDVALTTDFDIFEAARSGIIPVIEEKETDTGRWSQKIIAQICVRDNLVKLVSHPLLYLVRHPSKEEWHNVNPDNKEKPCSCKFGNSRCFHVLAVEMTKRNDISDKILSVPTLTAITKRKGSGKKNFRNPKPDGKERFEKLDSYRPSQDSLIMTDQQDLDSNFDNAMSSTPLSKNNTPNKRVSFSAVSEQNKSNTNDVRKSPSNVQKASKRKHGESSDESQRRTMKRKKYPSRDSFGELKFNDPVVCTTECRKDFTDNGTFWSLQPNEYINDDMINPCMRFIIENSEWRDEAIFVSSNIYTHTYIGNDTNIDGLLTDTITEDVELVIVLLPTDIFVGSHWMLGLILKNDEQIIIVDSLPHDMDKTSVRSEKIANCFNTLHEIAIRALPEGTQWSQRYPSNVPIQRNSIDCGLYFIGSLYCLLNKMWDRNGPCYGYIDSYKGRNWIHHMYISSIDNQPQPDNNEDTSRGNAPDVTLSINETLPKLYTYN